VIFVCWRRCEVWHVCRVWHVWHVFRACHVEWFVTYWPINHFISGGMNPLLYISVMYFTIFWLFNIYLNHADSWKLTFFDWI
jgi:hypothetical protein